MLLVVLGVVIISEAQEHGKLAPASFAPSDDLETAQLFYGGYRRGNGGNFITYVHKYS